MLGRKSLPGAAFFSLPATALAAGVDVIAIVPLYVVLLVLSMIALGTMRSSNEAGMLVLVVGLLVMLNWVFSFFIYFDWLANAIDNLGLVLVVAALSPFVIVQVANRFIPKKDTDG